MKRKKLLNITILSTTFFFVACSKTPQKATEVSANVDASIYNIIGVTEPIKFPNSNQVNPVSISPDVTYISYKKTPYFTPLKHQQTETVQQIEKRAKSFLGVPYVWGATGPNKFDCSGFTQWVYRDAGITIPRVSKNQARVGEFVKYENLERGDMVFFDTKKKRTGLVNHVGIYLGNGNFIHASSKGKGVVIYNFEQKQFYKKRFLWGRRVVKPTMHYTLK
jgi:cell wall-associated NlpC family hydrolase